MEKEKFTDRYYSVVNEALSYIQDKLNNGEKISLYDLDNTLYEILISSKYEGIYTIYELIEAYKEGDVYFAKGVATLHKEEFSFIMSDLTPDNICEVADRIAQNLNQKVTNKSI